MGDGLRHGVVNHRRHWVDPETGVHTQIVECMNGNLKEQVSTRGTGTLGREDNARNARLKFSGEVANGKLKRGEHYGHPLCRLLLDVQMYCRHVEKNVKNAHFWAFLTG